MSTRSQVHFKNSGVYLYQHYDGYDLPQRVQDAIKLNDRWTDEEYLTRIVFDAMKSKFEGQDLTTGFGIGTTKHSDIEYLVEIDCASQQIEVLDGYGENMVSIWKNSFENFVNADMGDPTITAEPTITGTVQE
tara:strand:+ start:4126 stop:4524 length:399 start_codon:yes stop_codon:yes gene_type:complete